MERCVDSMRPPDPSILVRDPHEAGSMMTIIRVARFPPGYPSIDNKIESLNSQSFGH